MGGIYSINNKYIIYIIIINNKYIKNSAKEIENIYSPSNPENIDSLEVSRAFER